jgi:hypothetical protein
MGEERIVTHPRRLGERELTLINFYANCQLGLSPRRFYAKWDVTYETISYICSRSPSTVARWFGMGKNYHAPQHSDLCHLALMDFILEHFEEIPSEWFRLLCSSDRDRDRTGK